MLSSLLRAATASGKVSLDIRGSQDKKGGLLARRHAEKKSDRPREAVWHQKSSLLQIIMKGLEDIVR